MRHTAGFDRVLDGSLFTQLPNDGLCASISPDKKWKISVEMELELKRLPGER